MTAPTVNGQTNGHSIANGQSINHQPTQLAVTSNEEITILRQTIVVTRTKFISDITDVTSHYIDEMSAETFIKFLDDQRLIHCPTHGSMWDRVLQWAEFFAFQVSRYDDVVGSFLLGSEEGARLIWSACRVLIELGPSNAQAVETAFEVFYNAGRSLSFFLQHNEALSLNTQIRTHFGQVFNDLLILVRDVALHYQVQVTTLTTFKIHLDFNKIFHKQISTFYRDLDRVIEAMWICKAGKDVSHIKIIQQWLNIDDSIIRTVLHDKAATRSRRHEFTCKWFQRPLLDFSRGDDRILAVTGGASTGKGYLASWIVEHLQKPLGKRMYDTLDLSAEADLPNQGNGLSIAKTVLSQLLYKCIGHVHLLDALWHAYKLSLSSTSNELLEEELWKSVDIGLDHLKGSDIMIVANGFDDRISHEAAAAVSRQLAKLADSHSHIKLIVLARNATHLPKSRVRIHPITAEDTYRDLDLITRHALRRCQHFLSQDAKTREEIIEKILHVAKGNFLSAKLMVKSLKQESSIDGFTKLRKSFKESSIASELLVRQLISQITDDPSKADGKKILSWLLVARRPLKLEEIDGLLQLHKKSSTTRNLTADYVKSVCGKTVIIQSGIVRLSQTSIRDQLIKLSKDGETLPKLPSLHATFVTDLLAFCKTRLTVSIEPVYELPEESHFNGEVAQDSLVRYTAMNWVNHFKRSSLHKATGPIELPADFKAAFPTSTQFALLEWFLWKAHLSGVDVINRHQFALSIRRNAFSENHESVLQNLILCGHWLRLQSNLSEAATYYYRASRLCQSIYKDYRAITVSCITIFLEQTASTVSTTRTEIVSQREELLLNIIAIYKQRWSKTSDLVVKYLRVLAELYDCIHEQHKSEKIWVELREIMITLHGKGSSEERSIGGHLEIILTKSERREEIVEYDVDVFAEVSHLDIWHVDRIAALLELAWKCEARADLLQAEVYFLMLWNGIIEHCHSEYIGIEIHISALKIALEYVRFLRKHHRHEEAAGILICIWAEYERHQFESETLFLQLVIVGEIMLAISLHSIALSVFRRCWSWFSSRQMSIHTSSCQILILKTVEEITKVSTSTTVQKTTSTTTTSTSTTSTETIIREVFESSLSRTTVTTETLEISRSLISFYMESKQWSKAIEVTNKSLMLIWRSIVIGGGICALPRDFGFEAIEIAIFLATCHTHMHHYHEAELVYIRIFRACFNSCQISDVRFTKIYGAIVAFYEAHGHWHKLIEIHKEVLVVSRKRLGASHSTTITILYDLGRTCSSRGYGDAYLYYEEIVNVLNTGSVVCHHGSLDAMEFLCRFYFEEGHWDSLKTVCKILWEVWTTRHHEYALDSEFVALLYMRYIYVLEYHSHAEFEIIRRISTHYWKTCASVFGVFASITLKSLITLADVCVRKEEYRHEAIEYYEEVIKASKTTTTTTMISSETISTIKERLTSVYIQVCSQSTVTSTVIERAIVVLTERFQLSKETFGCASVESLSILREIIQMHWKLKNKETRSIVEKLLLETTIAIITSVKQSQILYEAAKLVARLYIDFDLREEGRAQLLQIHGQVMSNTCGFAQNTQKGDIKLGSSVGRSSYVFLVVFEELICGLTTSSYTKIMADFLTETVLWQSYSATVKSAKNVELILASGARLYVFLEKNGRKEQLTVVQGELYTRFMSKWGVNISKAKPETSLFFFVSVLAVLGNDNCHTRLDTAVCRSSYTKINQLLVDGQYRGAYDLASCASQFLHHYGAYHHRQNLGYLFKLSSVISLRDLKTLSSIEPTLHEAFLKLSRDVIDEVLEAGKKSHINFIRLKHDELNDLIALLGFQKNYTELEWLLESLWDSREQQKKSTNEIITIGTLLAQVYHLLSHTNKAITLLADRISYNVKLVYSPLHKQSLLVSELLSQLYTEAKRYKDAMRVHEDILRLVTEGDDDDDDTVDVMEPKRARQHLDWLKQAYLRNGGWDQNAKVYEGIVKKLLSMPAYSADEAFKTAQKAEKWSLKEKIGTEGKFVNSGKWGFVVREDDKFDFGHGRPCGFGSMNGNGNGSENGSPGLVVPKRLTMNGLRKVSSHWGLREPKPELLL